MSAHLGVLRAVFRLKGTLLFWCFSAGLSGVVVAAANYASATEATRVAMMTVAMVTWMGWFLFLPRLWQLQKHAEESQLPGARRVHEQSGALMGVAGIVVPTLLLVLGVGADPGWTMLVLAAAMAAAALHLMLNPAIGVLLIASSVLIPVAFKQWPALRDLIMERGFAALASVTILMFWVSIRRWRSTMLADPNAGWRAPQVAQLAQRGDISISDERNDPARHWMSIGASPLTQQVGPNTPIRSLAVLLGGSLAPLGWRSYLKSTSWMAAAIAFLTLLSLNGNQGAKGPGFGLLIMLSVWSLAIPATLIMRLRQEWGGSGQALAEAFLLPGLVNPRFSWLQVMGAMLYTSAYRLSLPAAMVVGAATLTSGTITLGLVTVLIALWALMMTISLFPLAQRQSGPASFALYSLMGIIVITVIAAHLIIENRGIWPIPLVLPITTAVVLLGAALGGLLPKSQSPFALSPS